MTQTGFNNTGILTVVLAVWASLWSTQVLTASQSLHAPHHPLGDTFPIAVWLQQPEHAQRYKDLGINLYVGLWKGPTSEHLSQLKKAGMPVICEQNEVGLSDPNRDVIVGWLQQDEPDNAQPIIGKLGAASLGWGSPVPPAEMLDRYRKMKLRDPDKPVLLGLGKGVAWDTWKGRGNRTGHPEDYVEYVKAGDIVSFDIYPAAETDPSLFGKLEIVAYGVKRLVNWAGLQKVTWNTIGTSRVNNPAAEIDPDHIRAQVWMSIINGSRGIIYFVHQFKPEFIEATWFKNPKIGGAIRKINQQIQSLAKVILSPATNDILKTDAHDRLAVTSRRDGCTIYIFATSLSNKPFDVKIELQQQTGGVTVIDENRNLKLSQGALNDRFEPYAVHLYAVPIAGKIFKP